MNDSNGSRSPGETDTRADEVLSRLPEMIRESLTEEQEAALRVALRDQPWREHAVDFRVSLPVPFRPFYLTLVGDPERRSTTRRETERTRHPVWTFGNILFLVIAALLFYGLAIAGALIYSSVAEL